MEEKANNGKKGYFFTSDNCIGCEELKRDLKSRDMPWTGNVKEIDVETPEGGKLANSFGITEIPTIVDSAGNKCSYQEGLDVLEGRRKFCKLP